MRSFEAYFDSGEVSRDFETLFEGKELTGLQFHNVFKAKDNVHISDLLFVKEMNRLGVVLLGCKNYKNTFVFTKTHLFIYDSIDALFWKKYDTPEMEGVYEICKCTGGRLEDIIWLPDITNIQVGEGGRFLTIDPIKVTEERDPVKGAIIGGVLAGPTGAVIGAVANSGTKERVIVPGSYVSNKSLTMKLTVRGRTELLEMTIAEAKKTSRDKEYEIDHEKYYNKINSALSDGPSINASQIVDGTAAKNVLSFFSDSIEEAKQIRVRFEEACNYWSSNPIHKNNLEQAIEYLQKKYSDNQTLLNELTSQLDLYINEKKEETERNKNEIVELIKQKVEIKKALSFFKRGPIKKEINDLKTELKSCVYYPSLDEGATKKEKEIESIKALISKLDRVLPDVKKLKTDISSPTQKEYFDLIVNLDMESLEELLR